jgi:hypothetical protein
VVVLCMSENDEQCRCSLFGCHVTDGDVAPDSGVKEWRGGRG